MVTSADASGAHAPKPHIDAATYKSMYAASVSDPAAFWGEHGRRIDW
ncbi:acetyl-CoA synthetase, partial [Roseovarius azorensis]